MLPDSQYRCDKHEEMTARKRRIDAKSRRKRHLPNVDPLFNRYWAQRNAYIVKREAHIIELAIVGAVQGELKAGARVATVVRNIQETDEMILHVCGHEYFEGDAIWNVYIDGMWKGCRLCLPDEIEAGDVVLDRASAHELLATMLCGESGRHEYRSYFVERAVEPDGPICEEVAPGDLPF